MSLKSVGYLDIRGKIKSGDIIAFSGTTFVDEVIKFTTRSQISHVAIVLKLCDLPDNQYKEGDVNKVAEVRPEVIINDLGERIEGISDRIWWLPIKRNLRVNMDVKKLYDFVLKNQGKKFNAPEAVKSKIDFFDKSSCLLLKNLTYNTEDLSNIFCSEFAAAALKDCGVLKGANPSEVTPSDMCMFNIYSKDYYQIKGSYEVIKGYNTISTVSWGY